MFRCNDKNIKDKTTSYELYACFGYSYCGLVEGKNDTPYYVERFMREVKKTIS